MIGKNHCLKHITYKNNCKDSQRTEEILTYASKYIKLISNNKMIVSNIDGCSLNPTFVVNDTKKPAVKAVNFFSTKRRISLSEDFFGISIIKQRFIIIITILYSFGFFLNRLHYKYREAIYINGLNLFVGPKLRECQRDFDTIHDIMFGIGPFKQIRINKIKTYSVKTEDSLKVNVKKAIIKMNDMLSQTGVKFKNYARLGINNNLIKITSSEKSKVNCDHRKIILSRAHNSIGIIIMSFLIMIGYKPEKREVLFYEEEDIFIRDIKKNTFMLEQLPNNFGNVCDSKYVLEFMQVLKVMYPNEILTHKGFKPNVLMILLCLKRKNLYVPYFLFKEIFELSDISLF